MPKPHGMVSEAVLTAPPTPATPNLAPTKLSASARSEESDDYKDAVARLNPALRVIRSRCDLQWILQKKNRPTRWSSIAYCGSKEGLLLRIKEHLQGPDKILPLADLLKIYRVPPEAWNTVEALPDYFPSLKQHEAA